MEVDVSKDTDKIDDNENESVTEVLETKVESQGVTEEANMEKTRSNTESESGKENKEQITATVPLISKPTKSKITPYKLKRDSSGRSLLQRACKREISRMSRVILNEELVLMRKTFVVLLVFMKLL